MSKKNTQSLIQMNETSYKTINYLNKNFAFSTKNKFSNKIKSIQFFNMTLRSKNLDEDDTKNNQNFKKFMENLFKKDEDINEISSIHSNKIFFGIEKKNINEKTNSKKINNIFMSSRNKRKEFSWKENNTAVNNNYNKEETKKIEINKRSIGSECNLINFIKDKRKKNTRNFAYGKDNSIFSDNTTTNIQTFSFREFDGKMLLNKINEKKYFKKLEKIPKKHKKINSYNCIRKMIPKNLIPKVMFQSRNIIKREKENKMKLMAIKENAILFLKEKTNRINKNNEVKNSIYSYGYTNEKTNLTLNKKHMSNINKFPLIKLKFFYNDNNLMLK